MLNAKQQSIKTAKAVVKLHIYISKSLKYLSHNILITVRFLQISFSVMRLHLIVVARWIYVPKKTTNYIP